MVSGMLEQAILTVEFSPLVSHFDIKNGSCFAKNKIVENIKQIFPQRRETSITNASPSQGMKNTRH